MSRLTVIGDTFIFCIISSIVIVSSRVINLSIRYCLSDSSFTSTSSTSAIFSSISSDGCALLVHHFETVARSLFSCSANHLPVRFFSANTTFSLLMSLLDAIICKLSCYRHKGKKLFWNTAYLFKNVQINLRIRQILMGNSSMCEIAVTIPPLKKLPSDSITYQEG